jgi:hypothetical protein
MSYRLTGILLLSTWIVTALQAQREATPPAQAAPISVSLSASIEQRTVPLNRTVLLKIQISWEGNLDQVAIGQVTEPVLSNLEIVGTTASNRVLALASGQRAIKEVAYTLKPKALGMAYVEPVTLSYEDRSSNQVENLKTQRLSVEVVSPVPDKQAGVPTGVYWVLGGLALILCAAGVVFIWGGRRRPRLTPPAPVLLLEESYLNQLRADGGAQPASTAEGFARLSRLLRRYLAARYGVPALEVTTQELVAELPQSGLPEDLVTRCTTLLTTADVVKFSGQEVSAAEFQLAYATVETVLERNLAESRRAIEETEGNTGARKRNKSRELA